MKQETFKEFLEREGYDEGTTQEIWEDGARRGAEWQEKRMYSEEEVLQLLLRLQQTESYNNLYEWFEQFKTK